MLLGGGRLYQMYLTQPGSLLEIQRDLERALDASARATAIMAKLSARNSRRPPRPPRAHRS